MRPEDGRSLAAGAAIGREGGSVARPDPPPSVDPVDRPTPAATAPPPMPAAAPAPDAAPPPPAAAQTAGRRLATSELLRACDPSRFGFATTAELPDLDEIVGQRRAVDAVRFAIEMRREGYHLFALGPAGIGKHTVIRQYLTARASGEPTPGDWVYVHDFARPEGARALALPAGRGAAFRDDLARLIVEIRSAVPAAFEGDRYRRRKSDLEDELKARRDQALGEVERRAHELGVMVVRTPVGVGLAPEKDGGGDEFKQLPEEEQRRRTVGLKAIEDELEEVLRRVPAWERDFRHKVRELDRTTTRMAVGHLVDEIRERYGDLPDVLAHLDAVERDIVDSAAEILAAAAQADGESAPPTARTLPIDGDGSVLRRYQVNLLVDRDGTTGAPVVVEVHPTYPNLVGRVEYISRLGALMTDFTLVKAGALHRANGGYLVLDARDLLLQPYAWEGLKRAIRSSEIRIESLGQALSLISTVALEPEPIPLDVKIVLVGDRALYYLLCEFDPDFLELFKVQADFDEEIERTDDVDLLYARLLGTLARREGLRPLDPGAVARVIEHASRLAGDAGKVSTHMRSISDLIREADHWAAAVDRGVLAADDVQQAIDERRRRGGRVRELVGERIAKGTILIATDGAAVGQVNGLSVSQLGEVAFGMPTRITARVRLGRGDVVDIEREVELGGPIHSKGVLILSGFLGGRFGGDRPLAFHASLVFEQSYSGVEGDSASLAELCALISALADLPLSQSLAVTGSVDQRGDVQAIGGVNEKIEGFFEVCDRRGLTGEQGVVIPSSNVRDLMLRRDVVDAAEAGRFAIHAVESVDEALELLTGWPAGERDDEGAFPETSVNGRVEARLAELAERAREYASDVGGGGPSAVDADPGGLPSSRRS
jgi:lon-related putative ATP-dependent protease